MDDKEFFVTLNSTKSMEYFPNNKPGCFSNKLPKQVTLSRDWYVGLSQLIYSNSWYNINENNNKLSVDGGDGQYVLLNISHGFYETIEKLISQMTFLIESILGSGSVMFEYNDLNRKLLVTLSNNNHKLIFHAGLHEVVGFQAELPISGVSEATHVVNLHDNYDIMNLQCDVLVNQIVGSEFAKQLKIIGRREGAIFGEQIFEYFDTPQYLLLERCQFEVIEIRLLDKYGKPISFESGSTTIQLHFAHLKRK
jgi:hypothetical protein